ncbi:MAG: hypothetical protein WDZ80_02505 [Candidatus Paceibacterota bacterium]
MKKRNIKHSLFAFLLIALTVGCEEQDPLKNAEIIYVTEAITEPTTWYEGNIYIVDQSGSIFVEALLTIEPNVIVKFLDGANIHVREGGVIIANGTSEKPIIFTSPYDDLHGGDNTGNGPTQPAPGDWRNIEFRSVSGSVLSFCQFYYGGGNDHSTIKVYDNSTIDINNCVFAYNLGGGRDYVGVVYMNRANPDCEITYNTFFNNVLPMSINANMNIDNSNTFFDPENPETGNVMNGIFTDTQLLENHNAYWAETEVPFVLADDFGLQIRSTASLTLADNVVLKIIDDIDLTANPVNGIINSQGTGVYYTSFHDDSKKGDTNGNGSITSPAEGDWKGIKIETSPTTYADWSNILYDEIHE